MSGFESQWSPSTVAQLVEHVAVNDMVEGSIPSGGVMKKSKPKLPRGKMPPPTSVFIDKKKEKSKNWCRDKSKD